MFTTNPNIDAAIATLTKDETINAFNAAQHLETGSRAFSAIRYSLAARVAHLCADAHDGFAR